MIETKKHPIGKIFVAMKFATVEQVKEGLAYQKQHPRVRLGEIMRKMGFLSEEQVARGLAKQHGVPFVDISDFSKIPQEVLMLARPEQVDEHGVIPVRKAGNRLTVASAEALEYHALDSLRFIFGCEVNWCVAASKPLAELAFKFYQVENLKGTLDSSEDTMDFAKLDKEDLKVDAEDEEGVVAQLVQTIISDAITKRASDIHIEPMEAKLRIRYRVDGSCAEMECPPKRLQGSVIARLKILAGMDIAEKRVPQDGRIKTRYENRDIDLRVSALPCSHGESVVMRILDKAKNLVSIEALGMHPTDFERFSRMLTKPNGVFLVTGPTGSGKTTTLYAALQMLNRP
ncbi:MAG: Flp pilus assembly complex ATPase component TadA, partial [Planctomycetes bacterium]|nr:Flp pilus assembly complex ATPase component TadA [Planctomycetota bacterium]